jgi:hypothetical protein
MVGLGEILPYKNANILSQLWNIYPKPNMNISWFQTHIQEPIYLHIFSKKHRNIHIESEYKYCTLADFDLDRQFHTALK